MCTSAHYLNNIPLVVFTDTVKHNYMKYLNYLIFIFSTILISCNSPIENESVSFNFNGQPIKHIILQNEVIDTFPSGKLKLVEIDLIDSLNLKYQIEFYENGIKRKEGLIINNKKNGMWQMWYKSGVSNARVNYTNDTINGNGYEIDEAGGIRAIVYLNKGKLNGDATYFYENGKRRKMGQYINGKRTGIWKHWKENGDLLKIDSLKN